MTEREQEGLTRFQRDFIAYCDERESLPAMDVTDGSFEEEAFEAPGLRTLPDQPEAA